MNAATPSPTPHWRPRFGLASLLLLILVCCMLAAAARYLVQAPVAGETSGRAYFVISVLTLPVLLLVALNGLRLLANWLNRRPR